MTTAPVGQSYPVRLDQVAGNGADQVQGGDVQRLGPGPAPSKPPKKNASGPNATALPSVPVSKQKKPSGYSQVSAGLDNARQAAKAYDEARTKLNDARRIADSPGHKLYEAELKNIENLKAQSEIALKESARADIALTAAVSVTINKSSCTTQGKCNFVSAQKAAAKLDADVRSDGNQSLAEGTIAKDEARARQFALRTEIDSVLSDLAYDSLKSVKRQDKPKLLKEVASWIATIEDSPTATNSFGRLKPILVKLLRAGSENDKALIHDLLDACEKQRMSITNAQKDEVGLPHSSP
jgi:hypothetical protein